MALIRSATPLGEASRGGPSPPPTRGVRDDERDCLLRRNREVGKHIHKFKLERMTRAGWDLVVKVTASEHTFFNEYLVRKRRDELARSLGLDA